MAELRIEQWKRKLLDLSLRNPLLNVREGKKFLPICPGENYATLMLQPDGASYVPPEIDHTLFSSLKLADDELTKRLKEFYKTVTAMERESGINALFITLGGVYWSEKEGDELRYAPLILVPVKLVRQSSGAGYKLQRTDEDAVVNFCFAEMLRSQFEIDIPAIDGDGIGDGDPDFNAVFKTFAEAVLTQKGWTLTTQVALGIFSFSKIVIWRDLTDHSETFLRHPFVAHLAEGVGLFDDKVSVFPQEEVERHINPSKLFCPMSADSSQLAAVLYSELGKSFVLHGPPGTGKSQTITNIIAHNLALGKRVLFVSEKKAALDVVYRRLAQCGLAPFCLELHSNKADKANVMRQFAEALNVAQKKGAQHWRDITSSVLTSIREIGGYVKDLHQPAKNGLTAFECLARHDRKHPAAEASLIEFNAASASHETLIELGKLVRELAAEWMSLDREAYQALQMVALSPWSPTFQERVVAQTETFLKLLDEPKSVKRRLLLFVNVAKAWFTGTLHLPFFSNDIEEQRANLKGILSHIDGLRLVLSYRMNRRAVVKAKCKRFVEAVEAGQFATEEVATIFEDACAEKTLNTLIAKSRSLSGFSGIKQQERIARFKDLDATYTRSVQEMIVARLSKRVGDLLHPPKQKSADDAKAKSDTARVIETELALLKRECEKKKRFLPPRKLLAETSHVAKELKPCFLMSPLSVAQYLPEAGDQFDLIIFDEASQMTVWDAVGVIARGKQLIVVGDPKQLPPTNFFMKGDGGEAATDEDVVVEDLESVLDECLSSGMQSAHLNWHYRSRHEGLIAFSNRHYYDDRLNTFPAAENSERLGVSFRYVENAVYDHKTHTNPGEAEALVNYLFERLADPAERKRSWGIVTFSLAQQRLIESLIEKRSETEDWAQDFFDEGNQDAFFVKNLENVQGDERDVILFSVAYAPDAEGRFPMSFGPINRVGGERRLNVAITRAREQVVLFAAIHASAIRAERSNAVGVKHLKALMEYAETAHLDGEAPVVEREAEGGIRTLVCNCLKENGYTFELDYGMSSRSIDIAVRDPKNPEKFILGIECDGKKYAGQATVRDRDILRQEVLSVLGWKVFQVWSMDWVFDRKRAEESLLQALK